MLRKPLLFLVLEAQFLLAQSITGSIVGTVRDSTGLPVAGGQVTATLVLTGIARDTATNDRGDFVFSTVAPGEYELTVKAPGFKLAARKGVVLAASETRSVGDIDLEIGDTTQSVTVAALGSTVQTASSERGDVITANQIDDIQIRGRNIAGFLALVPGVTVAPDTETPNRSFAVNINGGRINSGSVTLDGMGQNQAAANLGLMAVSQDAVGEVRVLSTGYEAQYGRFSGANLEIVMKSGSRDFHGRASYFLRNEDLNANSFFNNSLGLARPRYRYNLWNYSIGGPVFIPKKWNRGRQKLFFFWSQEGWPVSAPGPLRQVTVPTAAERAGDFSHSLNLNGSLIVVKDPTTNSPFPGNIIPASRLDSNGVALLKSFPLPNFSNSAVSGGRYNFVQQNTEFSPLHYETLKLDYNLSPRH